MQSQTVIFVLCTYGFSKEFRPSEPFISPYLNGPKNFASSVINNDIFPIATYSTMSLLIAVFLLTDWLRYKPVLLLQGLSGIITWTILSFFDDLYIIQFSQVTYGLFSSCDVAYSSYLYAKIDTKLYQKATGQTKAVTLFAKASSGFLSQLLVTYKLMTLQQLHYLTLGAFFVSTFAASILPSVSHSSFFNRSDKDEESIKWIKRNKTEANNPACEEGGCALVGTGLATPAETYNLQKIFHLWLSSMKNKHTLKWSLWMALSLCGYLQVTYYIQLLWQPIINSGSADGELYHGLSNGCNALLGALCTYSVGYLKINWTKYGELVLSVSAIAQGAILIYTASFECTLVLHYVAYAIFKVLYQTSNTIASVEVAQSLENDSFGLVFGVNQFLALVEQSLLTLMVTKVLYLNIYTQFATYGCYYLLLGLTFASIGVYTLCHSSD